MGCQSRIQLEILNEEEGLILFRKHTGIYNINDSPTLDDVVKEVVGECMGLPLAIVTIGSALREKFIDEWKYVPNKLKVSKFTDIETVDQNVFGCLKLSYDFLKGEETKFCFLLCSLFPEDYEIDLEELLRYGLGLDLYGDANTIEEARRQLHVTITNLKSSCLLLDAKEGFVKMHDLVRDVALWITSKGENVFMVKAGMRLKEWPKHQGQEQCTAISLMGNRIEVLPDGLVCPKLKILLLEGNNVEVSDEFFEEMKTLEVASLSRIVLSVKSLQFLTNLVTLQLIRCELSDISSLKMLAKLEILSLKSYNLIELPEELGELSHLKMLDITDCRFLERIPMNVIPRLSRLEELYIGNNSFKAWEVEGTSAERSNASLSELSQLNCLNIISLSTNFQRCLPKDFVVLTKLLKYDIIVNCDYVRVSYPRSRCLRIHDVEATSLFAFKALYEKMEYLDLERIWGCCQNMVPSVDGTGLNELKRLSLANFGQLECIIDMTQQQDVTSTAFSNLVELSLFYVRLREICSGGSPPRGFLDNLETLRIEKCHNMSCLFPTMLIQRLGKLKQVTVALCHELEDVFQLEGLSYAKENPFLLSTLESLYLFYLHNLRYIWKDPTQQVSLQNLTVVQVKWCSKLRYLFTLSLARSLLQLEQLKVWRCDSLEHIVEIREAEENVAVGGGNAIMFPKLRILQLGGLENFINFCSENYFSTWPALQELSLYLPLSSTLSSVAELEQTTQEDLRVLNIGISDQSCNMVLAQLRHGLQNLEELKISRCGVQVLFQLEDVEQELSLPSLKVLYLYWLQKLECLCMGPTHLLRMPNLKKLSVIRCNKLSHMFSPSLARNFMQLEELIVMQCGDLEQIFDEDDAEYNHLHWPLLFPNLSFIDIRNCDKLRSMFPVSITNLLSLQNLTTVEFHYCKMLKHLFSSTLARNLLQLESIFIENCGRLEQILAEDHTEDDHVQLGLFPNLSSISVKRCGKLKTLFPDVTVVRSGLQKLKTISVESSSQLEELFGHKDEADMTSHREMVLPRLQELTLQQLESLENFCPVGYNFIFPSLSRLFVTKCPKITTRFSIDQNRSVHAEAKEPQMGKTDADIKQSRRRKTAVEIDYWGLYGVESILPPYTGKL
ncbi:hypothetical protein Ddye_026864 [Dipteronia dyeriana]|uniref:Disease resistance protein At4g27190-like leucine-rich repeats domain-containing protein n=1 Tax=Dipteronia dyeriana TaxID=168575 RepID=A0AAD9TMY7_9ROSI|nr:hypothetical protein Ddye_026864 [Dipteronia dyeriana]